MLNSRSPSSSSGQKTTMPELEISSTIVVIKPVGDAALEALQCKNSSRLTSIHFDQTISSPIQDDTSSSRECTPFCLPPVETELHLKFSPLLKDPIRGFVFGTSADKCDIVLTGDNAKNISREHFYIDFNWDSSFPRLINISQNGTFINAPSLKDGHRFLKHHAMHLLSAEQIRISIGALQFDVALPSRDKRQAAIYARNWEIFRTECSLAVPELGTLTMNRVHDITQFAVRRESRDHIYLLLGKIGEGGHGAVRKAVRQPSGELFAAKAYDIKSQKM